MKRKIYNWLFITYSLSFASIAIASPTGLSVCFNGQCDKTKPTLNTDQGYVLCNDGYGIRKLPFYDVNYFTNSKCMIISSDKNTHKNSILGSFKLLRNPKSHENFKINNLTSSKNGVILNMKNNDSVSSNTFVSSNTIVISK